MTSEVSTRKYQLKTTAESYFTGLRRKKFSEIPFCENIVFRAPIAAGGSGKPIHGKKDLFEKWWKGLEPALDGMQISIVDHFYNGPLTAIAVKADIFIAAMGATLRTIDYFIINDDGKITEQENHFDASAMKSFIHHICLRCKSFEVTKDFYQVKLGWPVVVDNPELIIFLAGSVFIAFKKADPREKEFTSFSPFEIGLDHVAITCETEDELISFTNKLDEAGILNTGIKTDAVLGKKYVAFKDPDKIQWEYYMK